MEDVRFVLFPRTRKDSDIWYCYIYDQNGHRKYRSTRTSNKTKARAYVLKKYRDGTLFEFKAKEVLFKDFAKPFWIWETCPIVNFKIKRGGTLAKGYCRSSRFLLDQKIIPAFGDKPIDFQFINMRLHKVLEANGIDWRAEGLSFHSFRHFFNTRLVANGLNGELVRATVGHESQDMTKHYLHLIPSDLNTVMDVAKQIVNL